jgi:hypothetical protein
MPGVGRGRGPRTTDRERDARGVVAAALWVYSLGIGALLGTVGVLVIFIGGTADWDLGAIWFALFVAILFGGGFGFVVGLLVGLVLGLIATISPPRVRVEVVTAAIPIVALAFGMTPVILLTGGRTFGALAVALDATLTLGGAAWVCVLYRRLEGRLASPRVH